MLQQRHVQLVDAFIAKYESVIKMTRPKFAENKYGIKIDLSPDSPQVLILRDFKSANARLINEKDLFDIFTSS